LSSFYIGHFAEGYLSTIAFSGKNFGVALRFHLTPVRMAKIKNSGDSSCCRGRGERGTLLHCRWVCKLVQPHWKSVWRFLRKLDIVLLEDPAIPLLGIYLEVVPNSKKDTYSTMFKLNFMTRNL
jgi:hypothetical protein